MATEIYMVTVNGVPLKRFLGKQEAHAMAERWQGQHGGYAGGQGLLKHKDRGDWVEVKRDMDAEKEVLERYRASLSGNRQTVVYHERTED